MGILFAGWVDQGSPRATDSVCPEVCLPLPTPVGRRSVHGPTETGGHRNQLYQFLVEQEYGTCSTISCTLHDLGSRSLSNLASKTSPGTLLLQAEKMWIFWFALLLLHVRTRTTLSVWKLTHRFVRAPLATSWTPQLFPTLWLGPVATGQSPQTMFHCSQFRENRYQGASGTYDGCPACGCKEVGAVIVTGHVDVLRIFTG